MAQEPAVLWYDECYRRIQRIKLVKTNFVCCSDCRLIMLYKVVKKLWANLLLAALGIVLLLPQELQEVWTNGGDSWIWRIKRAQKYPFTEF